MSEKYHSDVETTYIAAIAGTDDAELTAQRQAAQQYNAMLANAMISEGGTSAPPLAYADQLTVGGAMAYVDIPQIGVYLPVQHGTNAETLERSVGHVVGTSLPVGGESTHAVLSAHSGMASAKLFSDIDQLAEGDIFYIHVLGEVLAYEVDAVNTVLPTDTSLLQIEDGKDFVTLVTCTPFGINTQSELFDMIMVCHNLNPNVPSDVSFAESRVRAETVAAENVLHDMGVISMISSDSQAMGRVGENWLRVIQTADAMKAARGKLPEDAPGNDNFRVLRYVAKLTINPAITQGVSHLIGSVEVGKYADLVLWEPQFFGAKPKMVIKGGMISWANMGDPNASLPTPQPTYYRPMFGGMGLAKPRTRITFVSQAAMGRNVREKLGLRSCVEPVCNIRGLNKHDMVRNGNLPKIEVDPETFAVKVDGVHATVKPAQKVALGQLYFFS